MVKPIRKVPTRGKPSRDAVEARIRYFESAGSYYPQHDLSPDDPVTWIPFIDGDPLKFEWSQARDQVRRRIPKFAFDLMDAELGPGGRGRSFVHWPTEQRHAVYAACPPCQYE